MLREEAEREADRRNREDPDRERYEFYAFDESAGLAPDAWDVAARLRQGPRADRPATAAAAGRRGRAHLEPTGEERGYDEPAREELGYSEATYEEEVGHAEATYPEPPYAEPGHYAEPARAAAGAGAQAVEPDERPGRFVRALGAAVVVAGMLWMAMVVALAVLLRPDDSTSVAVHAGAAVLGLGAIALGVAIRRS